MANTPTATGTLADDVLAQANREYETALLDSLRAQSGQNLRELCAGLDMARQSVSKHLAVLEDANLVTTVWRGREKLHYLNAVPINEIAERWINRYDRQRVAALSDLKKALEGTAMSRPNHAAGTVAAATALRTTVESVITARGRKPCGRRRTCTPTGRPP